MTRTTFDAALSPACRLYLRSEVAYQHLARVPELYLDEVRMQSRRCDANVSKRPRCAKPVFAVDPDGLRSELISGDVFEAAQIAAELLEEQSQLPDVRVGVSHWASLP